MPKKTRERTRLSHVARDDLDLQVKATVVYEMDNPGRQLVLVSWDTGCSVPVFPDESALEPETPHAHTVNPA